MTVAREIQLSDPVQNQGAQLLKEACLSVNDKVGDGTTTAAIIALGLLREGHKAIVAGANPIQLTQGMRDAVGIALDAVRTFSQPVGTKEALQDVALLACNGDEEVARFLADACMAVGKDGTLIIEDGHKTESTLEYKEGMEIDRGLVSPAFFYSPTMTEVVEGALVAIINAPIRAFGDILTLLECAFQFPKNPLLLFAPEVEGEALVGMVINNGKAGMVRCAAVLAPGVGMWKAEYLKDIAALSKATFVDPEAGMNFREWKPEWFGSVRKATLTLKASTLEAYPDAHEGIQARIAQLKTEKDASTSDFDRDRLTERIAKLSGGLAVLKVGGLTEAALKERRARIEDALGAVRAALSSGVSPGGGVAYLRGAEGITVFLEDTHPADGSDRNPDLEAGYQIVSHALLRPLAFLATHAGASPGQTLHGVEGKGWIGWDARRDEIRDVRLSPCIYDPTGVVVEVIQAAVSVATTILTVETSVALKGKP